MNDPLFDLSGKIIVVTGGLGRLGSEFARCLVERGAKVAVIDNGAGSVESGELPEESYCVVPADVTIRASLQEALDEIVEKWGILHGLVNVAAIDAPPDADAAENGRFEDYPEAAWDRATDVNVKGVFLCSQVFGGAMAEAGRGSIVNIGSIYGLVSPDQRIYEHRRAQNENFYKPAVYSATKSALLNLTRYLATYWAPRKVRVNILTFGGVLAGQHPDFIDAYADRTPLGRMANPDEYNGAVVFLLSEAASYMTGSNVVIDGGWTAW